MGERIGAPRVGRMHKENLGGTKMGVLSDGNGNRKVSFLGRERKIDISGKNGEAEEAVIEFLRVEFGLNEEVAEVYAQEICEMGEE